LLATPAAVPQEWPAVILSHGQGLTLASNARTILPQLIVQHYLSNQPSTAERLADQWRAAEPQAVALHQVLGGAKEQLQKAIAAVRDPSMRAAFKYSSDQEEEFEEVHSTLLRKIDSSEPFLHYADWLDACIHGHCTLPEEPELYGPWGRRVLCWASRLLIGQAPRQKLPASWVERVIDGNAGIDSGVPIVPSWSLLVGGASGETALVEAARLIEHDLPADDEVGQGLVQALLTEGTSYRGLAHAEAVVALDERGESTRAWGALQSAAWWAARNTGSVPEAMFEGARFIATRHEWSDVLWVVERATGAT
jgi:hypothetical protein